MRNEKMVKAIIEGITKNPGLSEKQKMEWLSDIGITKQEIEKYTK